MLEVLQWWWSERAAKSPPIPPPMMAILKGSSDLDDIAYSVVDLEEFDPPCGHLLGLHGLNAMAPLKAGFRR